MARLTDYKVLTFDCYGTLARDSVQEAAERIAGSIAADSLSKTGLQVIAAHAARESRAVKSDITPRSAHI